MSLFSYRSLFIKKLLIYDQLTNIKIIDYYYFNHLLFLINKHDIINLSMIV